MVQSGSPWEKWPFRDLGCSAVLKERKLLCGKRWEENVTRPRYLIEVCGFHEEIGDYFPRFQLWCSVCDLNGDQKSCWEWARIWIFTMLQMCDEWQICAILPLIWWSGRK